LTLHGASREQPHGEPFRCFARRAANDLASGPHKLLGSALHQRREGLLMHGSLLLRASPWTPELPGVADLADGAFDFDDTVRYLQRSVVDRLAASWGVAFVPGMLSETERQAADTHTAERFSQQGWTNKR
jgi:lipoate-protein ligase A